MTWFKRKRSASAPVQQSVRIPQEYQQPGDWIMVPFRFAEAARVSVYTIGCQEGISPPVRFWIAQWLAEYNAQLVWYMKQYYGAGILPLLNEITKEVSPSPDEESDEDSKTAGAPWDHWEKQFKEDG